MKHEELVKAIDTIHISSEMEDRILESSLSYKAKSKCKDNRTKDYNNSNKIVYLLRLDKNKPRNNYLKLIIASFSVAFASFLLILAYNQLQPNNATNLSNQTLNQTNTPIEDSSNKKPINPGKSMVWDISNFSKEELESTAQILESYYSERISTFGTLRRYEVDESQKRYQDFIDRVSSPSNIIIYNVYLNEAPDLPREFILIRPDKNSDWEFISEGI